MKKLNSRKFWVTIAGIAILIIKAALPEAMDVDTSDLFLIISSYVVGQGAVDAAGAFRGK